MKHASRTHSISWFQDHYKVGRLELRPSFQRKPVWTDKQRSFLVESILLDIPIPEIYIQVTQDEDGTEHYGVVDGQQRLRTIFQFVGIERSEDQDAEEDNNSFSLSKLPENSIYKGTIFADLPPDKKKEMFRYEICVRYLYTEDQRDVEEVFKRLNKYSMPLKPQELRNATYHGAFARLSEELANDEYWAVNRIVSPAAIRRMGDIEMMSDLLIGLMHGPQGGSPRVIDQYYEEYEPYDEEIPSHPKLKKQFDSVMDIIKRIFPDISKTGRWNNRADFYSLFVATHEVFRAGGISVAQGKKIATALEQFGTEVDRALENTSARVSSDAKKYARAIEKGSNEKARRTDRHEALTALLRSV